MTPMTEAERAEQTVLDLYQTSLRDYGARDGPWVDESDRP